MYEISGFRQLGPQRLQAHQLEPRPGPAERRLPGSCFRLTSVLRRCDGTCREGPDSTCHRASSMDHPRSIWTTLDPYRVHEPVEPVGDAPVGSRLGSTRYAGEDHAEAARVLARTGNRLGQELSKLVRLKPGAHYGSTFISGRDRIRALRAAITLVRSAAVLACTSPGGPHAVERGQDVRRLLANPDPAARLQAMEELFYTPAWPGPASRSNLFGDPTMSRAAAAAHLRCSARHDAWDALPAIAAPTLILHGAQDRMTPPRNALLLAQRISNSTVRIHGTGRHGFFDEFAVEISERVATFLNA